MTWTTFFLGCFGFGFALSAISFLAGPFHLHFHVHGHGGHGGGANRHAWQFRDSARFSRLYILRPGLGHSGRLEAGPVGDRAQRGGRDLFLHEAVLHISR